MSVGILPPKTNLGEVVGKAAGQGFREGSDIAFNRNQTQKALAQLGEIPKNASSFELAKALIGATAGIHGAEKYVGQLFPHLLTQLQSQNIPEGEATPRIPGQGEGYLGSAPLTQPQKLQLAQQWTKQGIPLNEGLKMANELSAGSEQALEHVSNLLKSQGVTDVEMPYAIQMAQLDKSNDPNQLVKNVRLGVDEIRQLDNILTPGPLKRGAELGAFGFLGSLIAGGHSRDQAQKRLDPLVRRMSQKGYDPILREKLANIGMSPTEVQESLFRANHLDEYKKFHNSLSKFPQRSGSDAKDIDILSDFITKNAKNGVPLLPMRHDLWREKGYDWRVINEAFDQATQNGLELSPEQDRELVEFTSQPPRDSLIDIFADYGRAIDYFMSRK